MAIFLCRWIVTRRSWNTTIKLGRLDYIPSGGLDYITLVVGLTQHTWEGWTTLHWVGLDYNIVGGLDYNKLGGRDVSAVADDMSRVGSSETRNLGSVRPSIWSGATWAKSGAERFSRKSDCRLEIGTFEKSGKTGKSGSELGRIWPRFWRSIPEVRNVKFGFGS